MSDDFLFSDFLSCEADPDLQLCNGFSPSVSQDGEALKWASEVRKGDREIVMAAVQQTRLPTSPPRSYLTPSLVAGAGREHLPAATPKPQTMWK